MNTHTTFQQNLISPIEIGMTLHKLQGINQIWNYTDLYRADLNGFNRGIPSILRKVAKKLVKKQTERQLGSFKREAFVITLQPYEALALELFIRAILVHMTIGYERHSAALLANEINEKLS